MLLLTTPLLQFLRMIVVSQSVFSPGVHEDKIGLSVSSFSDSDGNCNMESGEPPFRSPTLPLVPVRTLASSDVMKEDSFQE
jgi:hypothetical protein